MSGSSTQLVKLVRDQDHASRRSVSSQDEIELDPVPFGLDPELDKARWDPEEVARFEGFRRALRSSLQRFGDDFINSFSNFCDYMANLKSFRSQPAEQQGIQRIFTFEYDNEKKTYADSFSLPVFNSLPEIIFKSELNPNEFPKPKSSDRIDGTMLLTIAAFKAAKNYFYEKRWEIQGAILGRIRQRDDRFLPSLLFKWLPMFFTIQLTMVLIEYSFKNITLGAFMSISKIALKAFGVGSLGLSFLFLSTPVFAYFRISKYAKDLSDKLDDIEREGEINKNRNTYNMIRELDFFPYNVLLDDKFPGMYELKWRYNYLDGRWQGGLNHFIDALKYADTIEKRFLCVRGIINAIHSRFKSQYKLQEYPAAIEPYVALISSDSKLHQKLGNGIREKLNGCLPLLINGEIKAARDLFRSINFDAYSKEAFPDIAVMYYQLDAIIWIVAKIYEEDYDPEFHNHPDGGRVARAKKDTLLVQTYLEKYYPQQAEINQPFMFDIIEFWQEWPFTEEENMKLLRKHNAASARGDVSNDASMETSVLSVAPTSSWTPQHDANKPSLRMYYEYSTDGEGSNYGYHEDEESEAEDAVATSSKRNTP